MTAIANHTIAPDIITDIQALQQTIVAVAKRGNVDNQLINYSTIDLLKEWAKTDCAEIILLTEKMLHPNIENCFNWLGVNNEINKDQLFEKVQTVQLENFQTKLYHIDNCQSRKIDEISPVVKIIYVDEQFLKNKDWKATQSLLEFKDAVCIYVCNELLPEIAELSKAKPNSILINLSGEATTPFINIINNETLTNKFPLIRLSHYIDYLQQVNNLISDDLKRKAGLLFGKSILNYQKQIINDRKSEVISSKQGGQFKTLISQKTKTIIKEIEVELEQVEANDEAIADLKKNMINFVGFKEVKGSRNITIKIPPTAIEHFSKSMQTALGNFYETKLNSTEQLFGNMEANIRKDLRSKHIDLPKFKTTGQAKEKLKKPVTEFTFEKPYEKQITKKGIGQLLMDLRTPIFMLMPFMMIAGVFGSLMGSKDVGQIDEATLFYQNRPCIVINQLPKHYDGEFRVFINNVDNKRTKGLLNKAIKDELATEPQFAVVNSVIEKANNRKQVIETLDYEYNSRQASLYLFLTENADRQFVINKLFDSKLGLLDIQSVRGGRMMGLSGLARAMSGLRDYRVFIIGGLLSLVAWFVITRKKSMSNEVIEARQKEQKRLKLDFKMDMERAIQQSNSKWKSKLNDYLNEHQNKLVQFVENAFYKGIDNLKEQKIQETDITQKRSNHIKTERRNIMALQSDQQRNASKLLSLQGKLKRQISRNRR